MTKLTYQQRYYRKHRKRILAQRKKRYREDAAYRQAIRELARRRYHEDAKYHQATLERARERSRRNRLEAKK